MEKRINSMVFYVVVALAAVLAIGTIAYAYTTTQNINVAGDYYYQEATGKTSEDNFGALTGGDIMQNVNIFGALTTGTSYYTATSTTGTATTLAYKDLANTSFISLTSNTGNFAYTMPATSTMMQILPKVGSTRSWLIHNATTTAATTLTLAAGTGMDLVAATANDDVIDGGEFMQLTCTQIPYLAANNENIMCIVNELANAD